MATRWIVLREGARLRWGGDLRRHYVLSALAARADALDVDGWSAGSIRNATAGLRTWMGIRKPRLAAATMLGPDALGEVIGRTVPVAVDIHDDPIAQNATLGIPTEPTWIENMVRRKQANVAAFQTLIVPSVQLAEIAELPLDRIVVAGNGTDTTLIRPLPFPECPAVGFMSGASSGRGIEALIAACRQVRAEIPDLRLVLWLAATGPASEAYLAALRQSTVADHWIEYASAPYGEIGEHLGRVTVQCVPNPASEYWDAVSPIKLYDAMASGRPVVVTPRTVMRKEVERHDAGLVAGGDTPADLAQPLARLLGDSGLAERLGRNARTAAESEHDWRLIATELAGRLDSLPSRRVIKARFGRASSGPSGRRGSA